MNENELRIGNWLNIANTETDTTVTASTFSIGPLINVNYKPIELDDFWLKRFGFWKDIDSGTFKVNNCTLQLDNYQDEGFMAIIFGEDLKLIKYVHQLQNLYFCLTNKELELCGI